MTIPPENLNNHIPPKTIEYDVSGNNTIDFQIDKDISVNPTFANQLCTNDELIIITDKPIIDIDPCQISLVNADVSFTTPTQDKICEPKLNFSVDQAIDIPSCASGYEKLEKCTGDGSVTSRSVSDTNCIPISTQGRTPHSNMKSNLVS